MDVEDQQPPANKGNGLRIVERIVLPVFSLVIGLLGVLPKVASDSLAWLAPASPWLVAVAVVALCMGALLFFRRRQWKGAIAAGGGVLAVVAVGLVVAMVAQVPLPWGHRPTPGGEQAYLARMATAQSQAMAVGKEWVEAWTPYPDSGKSDLDFGSVTATLDSEPMVRVDVAIDWYTKQTYSVTLLRVTGITLTSTLDRDVTFSFVTPAAQDRPASRGSATSMAAPAYPYLYVAAANGDMMRDGEIWEAIFEESGAEAYWSAWSARWVPGDSTVDSVGPYCVTDGTDPDAPCLQDASGSAVETAWGQSQLQSPVASVKRADPTLTITSSLDVTVPAHARGVAAGGTLTFVIPSPPDYTRVGYDAQAWTPLSQSTYPYLLGGLYLVSEDYRVAAVVPLGGAR